MVWQASGVIVNAWFAPQPTATLPVGLMAPPAPAEAAIVYEIRLKLAVIVWFAPTFVNVWLPTAPTETPSTRTSAMVWHASGVIVNVWSSPQLTATLPLGLMAPPAPADAAMV